MSTVVVQLGQCGNQIGTELFRILHSDAKNSWWTGKASDPYLSSTKPSSYYQKTMSKYFHERDSKVPQARAVLIDMETKVIEASLSEARQDGHWLYDSASIYKGHKGSGNNWANGFYQHGPSAREGVLNIIQREVEKCDYLDGFLVLMSVAGGTGSGLGTYITTVLRDEYPTVNIINPIIWPYAAGEVIVQNYNALLTTAQLYSTSDALILLLNDHLHKICSKLLHLKDISFKDLNKVASHALASVLQPAVLFDEQAYSKDLLSQWCSLSDLCTLLTPQLDYRLLTIKCVPQMPERSHAYTHYLWAGLLKYLRQMVLTDSPIEEGMDWSCTLSSHQKHTSSSYKLNKSLANLLIVRGKGLKDIDHREFSDGILYSDWVPISMRQSTWCSPHNFNHYEKSCTVVSNSQSCVLPLNTITEKAWRMYGAHAYVHQYTHFGLSEECFMENFVKMEQIFKNYSSIK